VDGNYVDTCWRERACWTGDARMMTKAVKTLTNNFELTPFVLSQIAESYDSKTGMVNGCWPTKTPDFEMPMATYHLAWCLSVVENNVESLKPLVLKSMQFWKNNYLTKGLITNYPGWTFVDWDFSNTNVIGQKFNNALPHCVVNSWWIELCNLLEIQSGISLELFDKTFWNNGGYALSPGLPSCIHATAAVLSSIPDIAPNHYNTAYKYLKTAKYQGKITAYFMAKALRDNDRKKFINDYYLGVAKRYGTTFEKHEYNASLAHGWSIGFVELL
jgi:hypothetical protein